MYIQEKHKKLSIKMTWYQEPLLEVIGEHHKFEWIISKDSIVTLFDSTKEKLLHLESWHDSQSESRNIDPTIGS